MFKDTFVCTAINIHRSDEMRVECWKHLSTQNCNCIVTFIADGFRLKVFVALILACLKVRWLSHDEGL